MSQFDDFHCRPNRAADALFGDPVTFEHFALSLRGSSTVTPHGRKNEGFRAQRLELRNYRFYALGEIADAATAASQSNRHTWLDFVAYPGLSKLLGHGLGYASQFRALKLLANSDHPGKRNVESSSYVDFDAVAYHKVSPSPFAVPIAQGCVLRTLKNALLP